MKTNRLALVAALAPALLGGCAYQHNFPASRSFIATGSAEVKRVFSDINGTFYPSGWDRYLKPARKWPAASLLGESAGTTPTAVTFRKLIVTEEARQLDELRHFIAGRRRLFILVHGFNNDESEAREAFKVIRDTIAFAPGDGVIEFYWDGMVTDPPRTGLSVAPLRFWFNAAADAKVAGARGLRRILALAANKDIHLISHSRGAAVILSALSNVAYDSDFIRATEKLDFDPDDGVEGSPGFLAPPPLAEDAGNRLRLLLLAPAIGCVDFRLPDYAALRPDDLPPLTCPNLRAPPRDLVEIRYTVNPGDKVLGKYFIPSTAFNPTNLGLKPDLGRELALRWPLIPVCLRKPHRHAFLRYVEDPELIEMLNAAGVATKRRATKEPAKAC